MNGWDGQGQGQGTRVTTYNWSQKIQGPEVGTRRSCLEKKKKKRAGAIVRVLRMGRLVSVPDAASATADPIH